MLGSFEQHREGKETTVVVEAEGGRPWSEAVLASASSATAG